MQENRRQLIVRVHRQWWFVSFDKILGSLFTELLILQSGKVIILSLKERRKLVKFVHVL